MSLGWALKDWILSPKPSSLRDWQPCSTPPAILFYFSDQVTTDFILRNCELK